MKKIFSFVLIVLAFVFNSFSDHKYYSSITKIEIDENAQLLKIHTQLFVEDFEELMKERYNITTLDFLDSNQKNVITSYLTKKLQIKVNRAPLDLSYLGFEIEGELLYFYLEAKTQEEVKRLDVENSLLQDLFSEQQNSIDVSYKNKVKSLHLHSEVPRGTIFY